MDALTNIYNEMHSTHWESEKEMEKDQPKEKNDNIEQDEDEFDECVETRRGKIPLKMTTEIMGHAVYTWMLLDFRKRWDIPVKFESKLSKTLTNILPALNRKFEEIYSKHTCNKPGCSHPDRTLIGDGNLKSTRRLCGADSAGIDKFETTGATVMTGCKNIPITGRKFCSKCENKTPHISHKSLSKENLMLLRDPKFPINKEGKAAGFFTIKGIHDKKLQEKVENPKKGRKKKNQNNPEKERVYLLSWQDRPGLKTWVPASVVPMFIINLFEKQGESDVPKPRVKETQTTINGVQHMVLTWENDGTLPECQEKFVLPEDEYDALDAERAEENKCNTRKDKNSLFYRRSGGIFIASWPCGVVTLFAELFNTESTSQVHGILSDFLFRNKVLLDWFLYDDACHLWPYAINQADYSKATKYLASVQMRVDKLHIRNHVGKWCLENCDPTKEKRLDKVNSVVCEQKFSSTNKFKNVKTMNSQHFNLYLLYVLDTGNLKLLKRLYEIKPSFTPKQRQQEQTKELLGMEKLMTEITTIEGELPDQNTCTICQYKAKNIRGLNVHIKKSHGNLDGNENETQAMENVCPGCKKGFSSKSGLTRHMTKCQPQTAMNEFKCSGCQSAYKMKKSLTRHMKSCKALKDRDN